MIFKIIKLKVLRNKVLKVLRNNGDNDGECIWYRQYQAQSASPTKLNFQIVDGPIKFIN